MESSEDEDDDVDYSDVFDYQMLLPTRITTTATTTSKIFVILVDLKTFVTVQCPL